MAETGPVCPIYSLGQFVFEFAFLQIMTGEEDRYQTMEGWRDKGNVAVCTADSLRAAGNRNCTNFYRQAIAHYTKALSLKPSGGSSDDDRCEPFLSLRIVCLANRAAAHLCRRNFGLTLRDCAGAEALFASAPAPAAPAPAAPAPAAPALPPNAAQPPPPPLQLDTVTAKCRVRAATSARQVRIRTPGPAAKNRPARGPTPDSERCTLNHVVGEAAEYCGSK